MKQSKPKRFDRNLIVIGGGAAGLVTAYIAATVNAKVTLIEKNKMGGDCLNTGCIPSKTMIQSARFIQQVKQAHQLGIHSASVAFDFADIMQRVHKTIAAIAPHDSVARYSKLGVECIHAEAVIESPWHVSVNGNTLSTRAIVIATGARPIIPPIEGINTISYLSSETLWNLTELPKRLLVLGGGAMGCELSQCFTRFGSKVTQLELSPRLLSNEDKEVSSCVEEVFRNEGIDLKLNHQAIRVTQDNKSYLLSAISDQKPVTIACDQILLAVGRKAQLIPGITELGIRIRDNGTIEVDPYLRTAVPSIYACGDVTGPYPFTHTAAHQAWYCAINALFPIKKFKVDYSVLPTATFIEPEVARVGLNEQQATANHIAFEISHYNLADLDRAITDGHSKGFLKVLTHPGSDHILGATVVAQHASEMITEFITAMKHQIGLNKILATMHIYPTLSEANKYVAGVWKKNHSPTWALTLLKKYHSWMRQ